MAKIKLNIASAISGKSGGTVYSRNRGGAYMKAWSMPINPNTPAQSVQRQKFSSLSSSWKSLTDTQRLTWDTGTNNFPQIDRLGDTFYLSGQGFYMQCNRNLQAIRQALISVCPAPVTIVTPSLETGTAFTTSTASVAFTPDPLDATSYMIIECSAAKSAGVRFQGRSAFKIIDVAQALDVSPADIFNGYNAVYGVGSLQAGARVFVRVSIVDSSNGLKSDSEQTSYIVS
jgi:hypothetical protein